MWYRFEEGNPIGIPRIEKYHVGFYDMERDGRGFDESFYRPEDIDLAITYVETEEDINNCDRTRVFAHFDNGDVYELKLEKLSKEQLNKISMFNGGKED